MWWRSLAVLLVALVLAGGLYWTRISRTDARCSDYRYQWQAQRALSLNPQLDRDHDGIACEGKR